MLVSSAAARLGSPDLYVDYAGSKAAVDALALGLSKELGREGVRVNSIRPGMVQTDIHMSGGAPERGRAVGATSPLGRVGEPEEIAEAIVGLRSDAASYVTARNPRRRRRAVTLSSKREEARMTLRNCLLAAFLLCGVAGARTGRRRRLLGVAFGRRRQVLRDARSKCAIISTRSIAESSA